MSAASHVNRVITDFPYRPELARISRNVETLGKDHRSSVVRIPTHTHRDHISQFPHLRLVSYGYSHMLSSPPLNEMRTQGPQKPPACPLPVPHSVISAFKLNYIFSLTVKNENINQRRILVQMLLLQKQLSDSSIYFKILSYL